MCEQCIAEAVMVREDIVPGYHLVRATKGSDHWPADHYGLVVVNGPLVTWEGLPETPDPLFGMSDDEIDSLREDDPRWDPSEALLNFAVARRPYFRMDPLDGALFVEACTQAGYDKSQGCVVVWFFSHLMRGTEKVGEP